MFQWEFWALMRISARGIMQSQDSVQDLKFGKTHSKHGGMKPTSYNFVSAKFSEMFVI